ncbi:helix-turn-helix transcriptional regulator [Vreelandella titanicae]|uniref:helix-turn-helix domain-containing protein n=1 Tax=Halomonadaceae TaxID=28256 RepID=UPI0003475E3D|nr:MULTISPECIES: helix-turn-helix transcriptional regulator [Halomonas]MCE7521298.1 helix-turn-helix transcriptional regulator [Halomonas titanicae]|tara:strand:+ start:132 stop:377 length:246 start_codon:yes stop_codon:yes gene_type:complete
MIRFRLKELLAEKGFQENRRVTIDEVSQATGIHRTTLSKIANQRGYNTGTENVDRLCDYFKCKVEDIIEHVPIPDKSEPTA